MKALPVLIVAMLLLGACASSSYEKASREWPAQRRTTMNQWIAEDYHADAIRNGVIAQHTLYDHHFVAYSDQLNELGERDAAILAAHYRHSPGDLNVRRGATDPKLHAARVETVRSVLASGGVDLKRMRVADAPAGGDGMAGDFVVTILEKKMDAPLSEDESLSDSSAFAVSGD